MATSEQSPFFSPSLVNCPDCSKEFVHPRNLQQHRRVAHEGLRYYCQDCEQSYTRQYNLTHHRLKTHPDKIPFEEAQALRRKFIYPSMAQKIKTFMERKPKRLSTGNLLRMGLTQRTTDKLLTPANSASTPVPVFISQQSPESLISRSEPKRRQWVDSRNKYRCMLCPFAADSILNLRSHAGKHAKLQVTSQNLFRCKFCDFATSSENTLFQHCGIHFEWNQWSAEKNGQGDETTPNIAPPMRCTNCDRRFHDPQDLINHESLHHLQHRTNYV